MIISRCITLILTDVSDKAVKEIKTHILGSVTSFWKSCRLWDNEEKNQIKPHRSQMAI